MKNFMIATLFTLFLFTAIPSTVFGEGKVHIVDIPEESKVFVPDVVMIKEGDTIRWINNDHEKSSHNFASIPGPDPVNKEIPITILKQDKTFEHTFNKFGVYRYFCYVHKGMVGKIIVTPASQQGSSTTEGTEKEKADN